MKMINIQVEKDNNESPLALLRRFNKRVQGSQIINKFKDRRYKKRTQSHYKTKVAALKRIERREEILDLIRQGKMEDRTNARPNSRKK